MAFTVVQVLDEVADGRRYTQFLVTEDDATVVGDEWNVLLPTPVCRSTLVEADLLGPAGAVTIQTELGVIAGWTYNEAGHVDRASAAAKSIRLDDDKRVTTRNGRLYGRSKPNVNLGVGQSIETRITIGWGQP